MPIDNSHLKDTVQVWDGLSLTIVSAKIAKTLVKDGTHQITTNVASGDLKSAAHFNKVRELRSSAAPKTATKSKGYKTREVRANS